VVWFLAAGATSAGELLPPDRPLGEVIDHYIDARFAAEQVTPAPLASDTTVLRRTMLDLVGRGPTAAEAKAYAANNDPAKRVALVDQLLASPGYLRHQVAEFDVLLSTRGRSELRDYLTLALAENRPWDVMFRELISGDESDAARKGSAQFLKSRIDDLDRLANETSVLFFGVNVTCAKCHDHPLVDAWTQEHFYGMTSFFSRTFENGGFIGERDYGRVSYTTVYGENRTAQLMFLTGTVLEEPAVEEPTDDAKKQEKERLEQLKKDKQPVPPPAFSRRAQLIDVALREDQRDYFAKAIVNQLWNRYYGYGLVMPIDQMHPENPPSHPELLEWLARDFVAHHYDLKRLMRGLVLSNAYARSSRWESSSRPPQALFAVANVRPLSPAQYAAVLGFANTSPTQFAGDLAPAEYDNRVRAAESKGRGAIDKLEYPSEGFQISVDEALLLSNNERVMNDLLKNSHGSLLAELVANPDHRAALIAAIWNVYARAPQDDELDALVVYLEAQPDRLEERWKQLLWAMLTSSETRFNY
jgi:hypothetical protein